jgi:hypothetical protein
MAQMGAVTINFDLPDGFLDVAGQRAGFVLLASFLISFMFIRTSARLMRSPRVPWWPGSVTTDSGLHLHHLVWGIVLLLLSGFLGFATNPVSPWNEILAGLFGVGAGLTLDEFALWIHLRDVYWTEEGRSSFDAVVVAAVLGGLIVLGFAPFDVAHNGSSIANLAVAVVIDVGLAGIAIFKGKPMTGLVGIFVPFVSLVGALRLASPTSPWGRRFYKPGSRKLARAEARWQRIRARRLTAVNAIAGAPGEPTPVAAILGAPVEPTPVAQAADDVTPGRPGTST